MPLCRHVSIGALSTLCLVVHRLNAAQRAMTRAENYYYRTAAETGHDLPDANLGELVRRI